MSGWTQAQRDAATRAVHEVTAGGIPFGKTRRKKGAKTVTVSAALVANAALDAAAAACAHCGEAPRGESA